MLVLRDYQEDLVSKTLGAWTNGTRKVLLQLSTGGGKTVIFAAIASQFARHQEGVLVIAHREELILQAASKLESVTEKAPGIIKAGYKPTDSLIQVGSIQTLARRKNYPSAGLVIIDEAHHASANSYRKLIEAYPNALILGVTATPRREDGYGLRDVFDELICSVSTKELIALGYLTDYKLIAGFKYSKHKVPKKRDFTKKELSEVAQDYKPEEVLKQWNNFGDNKKTIIFAVDVAHSKSITTQFRMAGIACEHIDGETEQDERKEILDRFRKGATQVISNCAILTEGFDCPDSEVVIIARPTTSVTLWLQMIGRVLRPYPGKTHAVIIDMTDNWYRLGRPCDHREWSLEPITCDPDTMGARCCSSCHHVFKPMPALIRTSEIFNTQRCEFVTTYEADCANCGKPLRWVLEEGRVVEGGGTPVIASCEGAEWLEVPASVRPAVLRPIVENKKRKYRGNKTYTEKVQAIKYWIEENIDVNLDEIKYALTLMDLKASQPFVLSNVFASIANKIRTSSDWDDVVQYMSSRSDDLKKAVWEKFSVEEKQKLTRWKNRYTEELAVWGSEENLRVIQKDLEACEKFEMFEELWQIYNKTAIRDASKRITGEKGADLQRWISRMDYLRELNSINKNGVFS
ncbi:Type III restriction enzyme, res subunit [Rivularia sp. IAM M-261]|nr:Type III restriction enzyme, res subunit [Rivularia sp. IAM M-261]